MIEMSAYDVALLRCCYVLSLGTKFSQAIIKEKILALTAVPESILDFEAMLKQDALPFSPGTVSRYWHGFDKTLEEHNSTGVVMLHLRDPRYPISLRSIYDPPPVLYLKGTQEILRKVPGIAIVGSRESTGNGEKIAYRLAAFMSENGLTVISGLARGIDAAAHRGALSVRSPNIAVLAHGLHRATPSQNKMLAEEILAAGGAWVSEHPVGQQPRPAYFVERNRIQIGLAAGSIIVEGDVKSGTMTQAAFCVRERRPLFAVVPDSMIANLGLVSTGPEQLVRGRKAIPVKSKEDYGTILRTVTDARLHLLQPRAADRGVGQQKLV
jgi:DNA processing protein